MYKSFSKIGLSIFVMQRSVSAKSLNENYTLSKESYQLLARLLIIIAKYEQKVEVKRQYLAGNDNYEPYMVF